MTEKKYSLILFITLCFRIVLFCQISMNMFVLTSNYENMWIWTVWMPNEEMEISVHVHFYMWQRLFFYKFECMSSGLNEKLLQTGINFIKGPRGRSKDICETSFNHQERTNIAFFFFFKSAIWAACVLRVLSGSFG